MAANLLVRRSTARLRCLVRSQVASFATERPRPSSPHSPKPFIPSSGRAVSVDAFDPISSSHDKYNPLRGGDTNDDILDGDKELHNLAEHAYIYYHEYRKIMFSFHMRLIPISFKEHLVKHCSHTKIQWNAVRKFLDAFRLCQSTFLVEQAEHYYNQTVEFRDKRKLPKRYQATLIEEVEMSKKELREEHRRDLTDDGMREIEENIMKTIKLDIIKEKKR